MLIPDRVKKALFPILIFIIVIAVTIGLIQLINVGIDLIRKRFDLPVASEKAPEAKTPQVNEGIINTNPTSTAAEDVKAISLLGKSYVPAKDVLSNLEVYNKEAINVVINGKFKSAALTISGTVTENGKHFLLLNYGTVNGILNAARLSPDGIDLQRTEALGGVFLKGQPMNVVVDLLGKTNLATSKKEFLETRQASKYINIWDSETLPPTAIKILAVPFNQDGIVGGAEIKKLDFSYVCEADSVCRVAICPVGKLSTQCLQSEFGTWAAKDWCERAKIPNCKL